MPGLGRHTVLYGVQGQTKLSVQLGTNQGKGGSRGQSQVLWAGDHIAQLRDDGKEELRGKGGNAC